MSSSNPQWIHDVFLSFRGEDTRKKFVSHLYSALSNAGINTFLDDEKLGKGQTLRPELWRAIEGSKVSVVVFSETYAESSWCLDELNKIMECHQTIGQAVLPIFYYVDPADVRRQRGVFGEALRRLAVRYSGMTDVVQGWKRVLNEAANLVGWDLRNCSSEAEVVKEVVGAVLAKKRDSSYLSITEFPVGLKSHVQDVIQFLEERSSEVSTVGIWGMGGMGKTTIAKAIYNEIHGKFADKCFLPNIREFWKKDTGQIDLQEQLLSDILKTREMIKIRSIDWGKTMINERLCGKTALVVLDDVNNFDQLNALCGYHKSIGPGSVIIVTTRDLCLLNRLKVDYIYRMKEMDCNESLELFSWHAFMEASPREDFNELSRNVVAYCGGLPLALEVLGCYLRERTEEEWKSVLSKLERIPNDQIQEKLKISFDGLDQMEQNIFLDICCFLIGMDRDYVKEILNGCGLSAEIGITILIEQSLIKVEKNNKLGMHSLVRDMGREIVRKRSPKNLMKRSRLWFRKDVLDVLTEQTGTKAIEGLALKLKRTRRVYTKAFKKMKGMRLLLLDNVKLVGDYRYLPKSLRWVYWQRFPLECTPKNFYQKNLVAIDFKHSNLKLLWKEPKLLMKLKILNLSHSKYLTNTPDFSKLPNLQKLMLEDCPSLSKVHQSIGDLSNLLLINLKDCTSLSNLPRRIYKLKSLKTLILSGCSKIDELKEDIVQMESLTTLIAKDTAVRQVPFSIVRSKSIEYVSLCGYEGLSCIVFPSLVWSWMSPTMNSLSHIHSFWGMSSSLVSMDVKNTTLGDLSPVVNGLSKLRSFWAQCHSKFQLIQDIQGFLHELYDVNFTKLKIASYASQISGNSLKSLLIGMGSYCQVIKTLRESISQGLTIDGSNDFLLPSDNYPYWLTYIGKGHSVRFKVPQDSDCRMKGMTLCVVYSSTPENMAAECLISVLIVNYTKCTIQLYKQDIVTSFSDEECQGIISHLGAGDEVEIFVPFGHRLTVKKTAVYLIYGDSSDMQIEPSLEPEENAFIRPRKRMRMCNPELE